MTNQLLIESANESGYILSKSQIVDDCLAVIEGAVDKEPAGEDQWKAFVAFRLIACTGFQFERPAFLQRW